MKKSNTLTRAYMKKAFQTKLSLSPDQAHQLLESIIQEINGALIREDYLKIFSFGTFLIHRKKERLGRNPKTKEAAVISSRKSVSFRPAAELRTLVNQGVS